MRKLIGAVAIAAALVVPAVAQTTSDVQAQYDAAKDLLLIDPIDIMASLQAYHGKLSDGLAGMWYPIGLLGGVPGSPEFAAKVCTEQGTQITLLGDYSLEMVRAPSNENKTTSTYVNTSGVRYTFTSNIEELFERLGLTEGRLSEEQLAATRLNVVRTASGLATLLRPSPDILVILPDNNVPSILARCPT